MPTPDYRETKRKYAKKRAEKYRKFLTEYKLERGCETCGYKESPYALQFDHRKPSEKLFNIAHGRSHPWPKFIAEIAKCRVLCANCHAIHTHS